MSDVPCVKIFPEGTNFWVNGDPATANFGSPQFFLILGTVSDLETPAPVDYIIHEIVYVALWNERKVFVPEKWLQPVRSPQENKQ